MAGNADTGPPDRAGRGPELSYEEIELGEPIGQGSRTVVFEGTVSDERFPDRIALKHPRRTDTSSDKIGDAFRTGGEAWATVSERARASADSEPTSVVELLGHGEERSWLAMERADGGSLADRLAAAPGGLPIDDALWIAARICRGVDVGHTVGATHLALTPTNVLFRDQGDERDLPLVSDWGIARPLGERADEERWVPEYAAPEQLDPECDADPDERTDVYQLGALLYAMLTGEPPTTDRADGGDESDESGESLPTPPSELRADDDAESSDALNAAVLTALNPDRADRYDSITEFERAIEGVRTDGTIPSGNSARRSNGAPGVTIVGCGGAGSNAIDRMVERGVQGATLLGVDSDVQHLIENDADEQLLLGQEKTQGRGAGGLPQVGEEAAREQRAEIAESVGDSDVVFVTAGLGGGTGTGATPIVAQAARDTGALTIAVVTLPFSSEGTVRRTNADAGVDRIRVAADTTIVIPQDTLLDTVPDLPLQEAFSQFDTKITTLVKTIVELFTGSGEADIDVSDVRTVLDDGELAVMGLGESDADGGDPVRESVTTAIDTFPSGVSSADGALVGVASASDTELDEPSRIVETVHDGLDLGGGLQLGTAVDAAIDDGARRTVLVATGIEKSDLAEFLPESDGGSAGGDEGGDDAGGVGSVTIEDNDPAPSDGDDDSAATDTERSDSDDDGEISEYYCPACEFAQLADGSSLRLGDQCPECQSAYLGKRLRSDDRSSDADDEDGVSTLSVDSDGDAPMIDDDGIDRID